MVWHRTHEENHPEEASESVPADHSDAEHHEGLCAGVSAGYQAIRYATVLLFPDEIPSASDIELSVAGSMPGVWDMLDLYTGRELTRPKALSKGLSLEGFVFTGRRVSTGQRLRFRLREGLIPKAFFDLKNQGAGCDASEVKRLKARAARSILSRSPQECFERLGLPDERSEGGG
jgi:hypothetical protein